MEPQSTAPQTSSDFSETLSRLSSKAGVVCAMVVDRSTNSVLQSTGSFSRYLATPDAGAVLLSANSASNALPTSQQDNSNHKEQGVEELAQMVRNYVNATDGLVHGINSEDDIKLLRLRTKKNELVIVPDTKYIFIVVHETTSA